MDHSQKAALIATSYLLTATRTYIPMGGGQKMLTSTSHSGGVKIDSSDVQILKI